MLNGLSGGDFGLDGNHSACGAVEIVEQPQGRVV